jgi:hypothetical protein
MAPGLLRKVPVPRIEDLNSRLIDPFGTNRVAQAIESETKYVQPRPHISNAAGSERGG